MSQFLRHDPCPRCRERGDDRSGDNLGVYTDHSHCFSCGLYIPGDRLENLKSQFHTVELKKNKNDRGNLPDDCTYSLRADSLAWLKKYGITDAEIRQHKMLWSPRKELLIFPIFIDGQMQMWQGRYFGSNPEYPKYNTQGFPKGGGVYYIVGTGERLVLVEDVLSAIKVGRQIAAMPLFTNNLNSRQAIHLSRYFDHVAIWLDPNMREHSLKLQKRLQLFFKSVRVIYSDYDPKAHSDGDIRRLCI